MNFGHLSLIINFNAYFSYFFCYFTCGPSDAATVVPGGVEAIAGVVVGVVVVDDRRELEGRAGAAAEAGHAAGRELATFFLS